MERNRYPQEIKNKFEINDGRTFENQKKDLNQVDLFKSNEDIKIDYIKLEMENNELKKSLKNLQESNIKYNNLYETVPIGILSLDQKRIIIAANNICASMLGFYPEHLLNKDFIDFIINEHRNRFIKILESSSKCEHQTCIISLIGNKKDIIHTDIKINPIFDDKRNLIEFRLDIIDRTKYMIVENPINSEYEKLNQSMEHRIQRLINENRCLEEKIKKKNLSDKKIRANEKREKARSEEFAKVLDAVPAAVWISHDNKGLWITGNQLSYEYLDLPVGANVSKSSPKADRPETFKVFKDGIEIPPEEMPVQVSSGGKVIRNYEFYFVYPGKKIRHMMGNATPLYDENGNTRGSVSAFIDVTHNKNAEIKMEELVNELGRSNKELEQFAYVTSHDLKEPLRMVSSFTQLLEKRYKGKMDDDADEFIEYIVEGAKRMQRLLDDLLEYARITNEPKKYESLKMDEIVNESIENLKIVIEENDAEIKYDPLPEIVANRTQMIQLFQNLISNAIKFKNQETPKIYISNRKDEDKFIFAVEDNGIGIDLKYQEKIFKVFQRLHTIDEYDGTGIGLSITQKIVEQHNGEIWIESELGKGSKFYFSLPRQIKYLN